MELHIFCRSCKVQTTHLRYIQRDEWYCLICGTTNQIRSSDKVEMLL